MKKQTEASILFQCKNYRENLKFAYLHRLVEEVSQRFTENLTDKFRIFDDGTVTMENRLSRLQTDKEHAIDKLREMEIIASSAGERMKCLRRQIDQSEM